MSQCRVPCIEVIFFCHTLGRSTKSSIYTKANSNKIFQQLSSVFSFIRCSLAATLWFENKFLWLSLRPKLFGRRAIAACSHKSHWWPPVTSKLVCKTGVSWHCCSGKLWAQKWDYFKFNSFFQGPRIRCILSIIWCPPSGNMREVPKVYWCLRESIEKSLTHFHKLGSL